MIQARMPLAFLPTWAHTGSCSANCQTAHPGHFPLGHSFYLYLNLLWCNVQLFPCVVWLDLMKKSVIMFRPRWSLKSLSLIVWQRRQALTSPRVFAQFHGDGLAWFLCKYLGHWSLAKVSIIFESLIYIQEQTNACNTVQWISKHFLSQLMS